MVTCAAVVLQGCPDRVRWPKASKGDPLLKIGCHLKTFNSQLNIPMILKYIPSTKFYLKY